MATGSMIGQLEKVRALAVSDRVLAIGGVRAGASSRITFFDFVAEKVLTHTEIPAHVLALAGDKEGFVAACSDGRLRWLGRDGSSTHVVQAHEGAATAVALHKGSVVSAGADGVVRMFSRETGRADEARVWQLSSRALRAVAIDPAGEAIAGAGDDGVVRVVWLADGRKREMPGHEGAVLCLVFTPADGRLASGGEDGTTRLWYLAGEVEADVRGKDELGHTGGTTAILFPPAKDPAELGERFFTCGADGKLRFWRTSERRRPRLFEVRGQAGLFALVFAPIQRPNAFGRLYAGGDLRTLFAFNFDPQGNPVDTRTDHPDGFDALGAELSAPAKAKREAAVRTLAALDEPEALALALKALTEDRDPDVRALAATELATNGRKLARKTLRDRLNDDHPNARKAALAALRTLETDAPVTPLRAALDSRHADIRAAAVHALAPLTSTSPLVVGLVTARLSDRDTSVRRAAFAELPTLFNDSPVEALRAAFERGAPDVRASALARGAATNLSRDAGFAALVGKGLDDEDAAVRRVAFVAATIPRRALSQWLEASDESFARAVTEVARGLADLDAPDPEPGKTAPEIPAATIEAARVTLRGQPVSKQEARAALGDDDREPLLSALSCRTADTCLRGARGLALLGDMRALGALLTISRDPSSELRREAAKALVALEDARAKRRLAWMMNDPDPSVRDTALGCYRQLEPDMVAAAEIALQSAHEDIRVRGLDLLVTKGKGLERAEVLLGDALEDEAPKVRAEAFRTLWAWHDKAPLGPIDRALVARFPDLRKRALDSLTSIAKGNDGDKVAARERIQKTISDRDASVGRAALEIALDIEGKTHVEGYIAALASTAAEVRTFAAKKCVDAAVDPLAPEKLRSPLMKLLEDTEAGVRQAALEALDKLFPQDAAPLHIALQSSHLDLRVRAAELLADRRDDRLVNPMQALVADKELLERQSGFAVPLRRRAATALANLGAPKLLRYYATDLIKDTDPIVREQAARGTANASRVGEEGFLLDLLGHEAIEVRSWAAEGLARLGDARALPVMTGTLSHAHPPIRIGAILSFAAVGPDGYGGMLQGLEDASREVQRIVLSVILARDLRAFRRGESPDLLTSALSSQRAEVRFAAARALELRIEPELYLAHLVELLHPERPEREEDLKKWPNEATRARIVLGLAEALAGDRPEQRYAAAQALRLRDRPLDFFREAQRAGRPRASSSPWVPETSPVPTHPPDTTTDVGIRKGPLGLLRRLFASGPEAEENAPEPAPSKIEEAERGRLRALAFGAYVGLLRHPDSDDESNRVRRDAIERIVELTLGGHVSVTSATPALARALDDPNHLARRAAAQALRRIYANDPEAALTLTLASSSADVVRGALDELASRGDAGLPRVTRAMDSDVKEARAYAFELLEKMSPKGSVEPLLAALKSTHADLRIGVVERLATSQDPRVATALGKALESDHDDLRLRAAELLAGRRDDRAVDVLAGYLRSDDAPIASRARNALALIGSAPAIAALASRLEEQEAPDRVAVVQALGATRSGHAIEPLAACTNDDDLGLRTHAEGAAMHILRLPIPEKQEWGAPKPKLPDMTLLKRYIEVASKSRFPEVRMKAATCLYDLEDPDAEALLVALFGDRVPSVRAFAVAAYARRVQKKGAPPAPLEEVVRGGARETMLSAAEGLAWKGNIVALRPLLLFVRAGEPGERERAILGLGVLGDKRALAELEIIASGGTEDAPAEESMQAAAIEALGRMHGKLDDDEAQAKILDRIDASVVSKNTVMSVAAIKALGHLGGERSRARLETIVRAERSSQSVERRAAAQVLGKLGDVAAEKALGQALQDDDYEVRNDAREALGKLFPNERTRIELAAVGSAHEDIAGPAAAFLATEGDAAQIVEQLVKIDDDDLLQPLLFGLTRRPSIPVDSLVKLLDHKEPTTRRDAAWLAAMKRDSFSDEDARTLGAALVAALSKVVKARTTPVETAAARNKDLEDGAERRLLWAARKLAPEAVRPVAAQILADTTTPWELRAEAARALAGDAKQKKALEAALTDPDIDVRRDAVSALAASGATVASATTNPTDPVLLTRVAAARPMSEIDDMVSNELGRRIATPLLQRDRSASALLDVARDQKASQADRLGAIGALSLGVSEEAIEQLSAMCSPDGKAPKGSESEALRKAAYRALRRIQRNRARSTNTEART